MLSKIDNKSGKWARSDIYLFLLAAGCFLYALFIALRYADQLPLDFYSFRQTQTAITTYWLGVNGFSLNYETPVVGPPWAIPFEFPLYQYIVLLLSQSLDMDLNAAGRIVSFVFLALCVIPVSKIGKQLDVSRASLFIFFALLFSSPLYLYWGRTFMIETAALFFTLMAVAYFLDILAERKTTSSGVLFLIFIILAIVQKATTPLPVLAVLACVYLIKSLKDSGSIKALFAARFIKPSLLYFALPLLVGTIWTLYTDQVKSANSFGMQLTSGALSAWNWGTWADRLSPNLYSDVIWRRMLGQNLAGALGLALLVAGIFMKTRPHIKTTILICVVLGIVPLFIFPNLHIIHEYYQTANVVFLLFAVALVIGESFGDALRGRITAMIFATLMVASNQYVFASGFLKTVQTVYTPANSRDLDVADTLKANLPKDAVFVTFGDMWSSSFSYFSGHKSFTVPDIYDQYEQAIANPENYVGDYPLGAVVVCRDTKAFLLPEVTQWAQHKGWKVSKVHGCYIALPERLPVVWPDDAAPVQCEGSIDYAGPVDSRMPGAIDVKGWTTVDGEKGIVPESTYVRLTDTHSAETRYYETTSTYRPDVHAHFGHAEMMRTGFSRLITLPVPDGQYVVGLARIVQGKAETCQFAKEISAGK